MPAATPRRIMQRILTIAKLTWKAAFRFRLFWVLLVLLLGSVVVLPLLLKDDGTARGFTQILLTYNLSVITVLLGFSTLWLACGTLARDIEDSQIQMVAVKPVARWEIWLGKWIGIMMLNTVLLAVSGGSVFALLQWRASQLPEAQQAILREEIFVARASLKEAELGLEEIADRVYREQVAERSLAPVDRELIRRQILEELKGRYQIVPPDHRRQWTFQPGLKGVLLRDKPLFIRFKFHAAETNAAGTYVGLWQVGPPGSQQRRSVPMDLAADTYHEIPIPSNLFDTDGNLIVEFVNRNDTRLLFPLEDGFEVLYREGGFALNYVRGLMIILSWMGLLAALGLASASLLSFPVAAFFSFSLLVVALSSGTLSTVVEEGTVTGVNHETGGGGTVIDTVLLPVFKTILKVVSLVAMFSPVDALSTGRSITWGELGLAWGQVVFLLGGILALLGILFLNRRELALPQGAA
jgi:hypothetical protein